MDNERLQRIRNIQSRDWYETLIMRPLAIAVLVVAADWRLLTPNIATTLANVCKLAGAGILLVVPDTGVVAAIALMQIGLLFDHIDGQLARYRRQWSSFGSFYDKASDGITWTCIVMAIGWVAFNKTNDPRLLVCAGVATTAGMMIGYMKWVAEAEAAKLDWFKATETPQEIIAARTQPPKLSVPPTRTPKDWAKWFGTTMLQVFRIQEMDLYFWVSLLLLLGKYTWIMWFLAATQLFGMIYMFVARSIEVTRLDRKLAKYRER